MTDAALFDALDATWPAAATTTRGPWRLRKGEGGGKRVSAASALTAQIGPSDIEVAEAEMRRMGQTPLFQIRDTDNALDQQLETAGYQIIDPVRILTAPVAQLAEIAPPPITAFVLPEPLAIMYELWAEAGTGPERLAVMDRVIAPKTVVLGRISDRASGVAFAAIHGKTVFCHALEVISPLRRQGTATNMLRAAAIWAQQNGAETFATLVLENNSAALALYASLKFKDVGHYHYRIKPSAEERA
ncbi:MAG: GNAT family N-acetyltransferase [Planctomycetales bacterium]|nr:GNAT family N-acetyltransferase [Planctomycetales bacterium]NIP04487.1 GNAT family N-acetyltransferase [Planctomycetales bacterium]